MNIAHMKYKYDFSLQGVNDKQLLKFVALHCISINKYFKTFIETNLSFVITNSKTTFALYTTYIIQNQAKLFIADCKSIP